MCVIRDVVPAVPLDSCHIFADDLLGKEKAGVFLFWGGGVLRRGLRAVFPRLVRPFDANEIAELVLQNRNSL